MKIFKTFSYLVFLLFLVFLAYGPVHASDQLPVKRKMKERVDFWVKVYTEITSKEAFLHDTDDVSIIYKKIKNPKSGRRSKRRWSKQERDKIKKILRSIAKKKGENLNKEEKRIFDTVGERSPSEYRKLAKRVRYQYGLKDQYYAGLKRSHRYMEFIKKTFKEYGLPDELVYLPHVESSFNYHAYSKVGAAGMWQFMRSTARLFRLKVNYIIDERRDPFRATVAAAKLLKANYGKLGKWPLAITAYNHGALSINRAVNKLGTDEIDQIVERYDGRRFGFASKNFYATFMATVKISKDPEIYFKGFKPPPKFVYSTLELDKPYTVNHLKKALKLSKKEISDFNPSIRKMAFRNALYLPKGFELKMKPISDEKIEEYRLALSKIKTQIRDLKVAGIHRVTRGESLYTISRAYRVSMIDLIRFNAISNPSRIRSGMKIKIPGDKEIKQLAKARINKQKKKIPAPVVASVSPVVDAEKQKDVETVVAKVSDAIETEELNEEKNLEGSEAIKIEPTEEEIISQEKKKSLGFFAKVKNFFTPTNLEQVSEPQLQEKSALKDEVKSAVSEIKEVAKLKKYEQEAKKRVSLTSYELDMKKIRKNVYKISVEPEETLGHYAEWAGVKTQRIRSLNGYSYGRSIGVGQKLKVYIPESDLAVFQAKRVEYHVSIQEDFYENYRVSRADPYRVTSGDILLRILRRNSLPMWLLRKYQEKKFELSKSLVAGETILIPKIETIKEEEAPIYEGIEESVEDSAASNQET